MDFEMGAWDRGTLMRGANGGSLNDLLRETSFEDAASLAFFFVFFFFIIFLSPFLQRFGWNGMT